ncbi:MAG: M28 family peptidase [Clostridia bacterium]|nr:M28 family peptidase [Clostridia bacterium]
MTILETLVEQYPIRKTKKQKEAFREWAVAYAQSLGYSAQVEKKGSSHNIVIGDPETAEVVFGGHYDTPPGMPVPNFITPRNIPVFLMYQIGLALLMILPGIVVGALCGWLVGTLTGAAETGAMAGALITMVCMYAIIGLMMFGPANRSNVNDNTSGTAAVLELLTRLPEKQRSKAAFILFDNEEKGMLGSAGYASKHKTVKTEKLVVNMDCVGDGEHMLFIANRKTRALPSYEKLAAAIGAQTGCEAHFFKAEGGVYPSDQANFTLGMAVCACKRAKSIGFYCDRIHTRKDTVCRQENLDFLADGLSAFVESL